MAEIDVHLNKYYAERDSNPRKYQSTKPHDYPISNLLNKLDKVKRTGNGTWIACCPAHEDKTPSLSIKQDAGDHILIHCFAGCNAIDVLGAIGLKFIDLVPIELRRYATQFEVPKPPRSELARANEIAAGLMEIELRRTK